MYACMFVYMFVCIYVCMCLFTYAFIYKDTDIVHKYVVYKSPSDLCAVLCNPTASRDPTSWPPTWVRSGHRRAPPRPSTVTLWFEYPLWRGVWEREAEYDLRIRTLICIRITKHQRERDALENSRKNKGSNLQWLLEAKQIVQVSTIWFRTYYRGSD